MGQSLKSIRRRAVSNELEVEHILEAAVSRLAGLPSLLVELSASEDWSDDGFNEDGSRVIPFARWARVASAYCDDGIAGLGRLLSLSGHENYVLALLQELRSAEAVEAMMDWFSDAIHNPSKNLEMAHSITSTLNQMFLSSCSLELPKQSESLFREMAHALARLDGETHHRATAVLLLRFVGDETSLALLKSLPPFVSPWDFVASSARRAILKRMKVGR